MIRRSWIVVLVALTLALAPSFAEARAGGSYRSGGGSSFTSQGSRGFGTYQYNGGAPITRSITPQSAPSTPYGGYQPGYGYGYGHPFFSGLFGGFFGSWLGSMLFPHWGMGWGFGGMLGSVFSWLLLMGVVWFLFRLFAGRRSTMLYGGSGFASAPLGGAISFSPQSIFGGYAGQRVAKIGVVASDYAEFEDILKGVQTAWSRGDLAQLRSYVTPEMLSYFAEQLGDNQSHGVANHVDDVELIKGEVREAWDEGSLQYATALLHWRARDYTVSGGTRPGEAELIVGGDPQHASEASEIWTFVRSPGGHWLLSAIQQLA